MKNKTALSVMTAAAILGTISAVMPVTAAAETALAPTGQTMRFSLGSDSLGGTGVESGGKNWVKVIQNSNAKHLFENHAPDTDIAALQVVFDISNWSGTAFDITWGGNIIFTGDTSATWCGTGAFEDISQYKIEGDGEYSVICDLDALCASKGKTYSNPRK